MSDMDSKTPEKMDSSVLVDHDVGQLSTLPPRENPRGEEAPAIEKSEVPLDPPGYEIETTTLTTTKELQYSPQGLNGQNSSGSDAEMSSPKGESKSPEVDNEVSPTSFKSPSSSANKVRSKDNERKRKLSPEDIEMKKKAKLEREALRKEKEMKKQEQKIQREKERQEKQLEKEKKEKEKEERKKQLELERQAKKEQLDKEREEKQKAKDELKKRKLELNQLKEEERKKKEEERKKKEEERKKKEEEKRLQEEEEERKRERKRQAFKSFFIKNTQTGTHKEQDSAVDNALFKPFQLRPGVVLAPIHPGNETVPNKEEFDKMFAEQALESLLYLGNLQKQVRECGMKYMTRKQWRKKHPLQEGNSPDSEECVEITEERDVIDCHEQENMKVKLLQFHENSRPAWYGTWTKQSKTISGRRPLGKDEDVFNYEIDSDDEWEEDDPGESLSSVEDDDKDDEVEKDNEEDDDGFFVPHGYLSDDEGIDTDEEENAQDASTCRSPKTSNDDDYSTREKVAQPVCIGCVWGTKPEDVPAVLRPLKVNLLNNFTPEPIDPEVEKIMQNFINESRTRFQQSIVVT